MEMTSWRDSKCPATVNPEEAVPDTSHRPSVLQESHAPHIHDKDGHSGTCMHYTEDEKHKNDSRILDNMLQLKEQSSSFHDQDYTARIEEFQFYVEMVKKMARPGCSPETLNVALSSMTSLVTTLSVMSSRQYIQSSL